MIVLLGRVMVMEYAWMPSPITLVTALLATLENAVKQVSLIIGWMSMFQEFDLMIEWISSTMCDINMTYVYRDL